MLYVVVSCIEREITGEVVTDNFPDALEEMKKSFLNFHRKSGYSEEDIEILNKEITFEDSEIDIQTVDYGFCSNKSSASAWSNINDNCNFDIKIIEIPAILIKREVFK